MEARLELLGGIEKRLAALETKVDYGFARIDARFDLIDARFAVIEGALIDISAREHNTATRSGRVETVIERHDRELAELRARIAKLEPPIRP